MRLARVSDDVERPWIAQVRADDLGAAALFDDAPRSRLERRFAPGDQHDDGAMARKPNGGPLTEAAARARHHRNFPAQVRHRDAPARVSRWNTSRMLVESTMPSSRKNISGFIASSDHRS